EPVSIAVAIVTNPVEGLQDGRPEHCMESAIGSALVITSSENDIERRGVDGAVVLSEGNLAECSHLPFPLLMQDFSRLRILRRVRLGRLHCFQIPQDTASNRRENPERLQRGDDAVPAKWTTEPRDAGKGI